MRERFQTIIENWFLFEPLLFSTICTHELVENNTMSAEMRCGKMKIEYNSLKLNNLSEKELDNMLRVECIRILLKHPYERQIEGCTKEALAIASDIVIGEHYPLLSTNAKKWIEMYKLLFGECMEWYANKINNILNYAGKKNDMETEMGKWENGNGKGENGEDPNRLSNNYGNDLLESYLDKADLWDEDPLISEDINRIIQESTSWGTIPSNMVEMIKASLIVKLDYKKILRSFHTSIVSAKRRLSRMRPNRRNGFLQMGSLYELKSKILIAVDVSGSISTQSLDVFYSAINRFFKYGVETLDVIQFDCEMKESKTFKKAKSDIEIIGRGGTNFQIVFDYMKNHSDYDGLIIFTDGYAKEPEHVYSKHTKVMWVCDKEEQYEIHHSWMSKTGRVCWINH